MIDLIFIKTKKYFFCKLCISKLPCWINVIKICHEFSLCDVLQGVCIEYQGEAKCDCPAPYAGAQCTDASEVADFMLNEINNNNLGLVSSSSSNSNNNYLGLPETPDIGGGDKDGGGGGARGWVPDCAAGECRVPDFNGESYLEFPTLDNVAKFADIEVSSL